MTVEHVRAALQRWDAHVQQGSDPMNAILEIAAPECIVHSQNGEVGPLRLVATQMAQARRTFPDLEAEIEQITALDDRLIAQMKTEATPDLPFGIGGPAKRIRSSSAVIARVNEHAEFVEFWPYSNPGASFTFPPRTKSAAPPPLTGTPPRPSAVRDLGARDHGPRVR